jgi:hypothetical protein
MSTSTTTRVATAAARPTATDRRGPGAEYTRGYSAVSGQIGRLIHVWIHGVKTPESRHESELGHRELKSSTPALPRTVTTLCVRSRMGA